MDTAAWTGAEFHPPTVCQLKWVSAIRKRENTAVILLYDLGDMDLGGEFFKQNITWDPRDESLLNKKNGRWIQDEFGLGRVFDIWYCGWNPAVFDRYSFFHYRFLSQVLIIALYNYVTWHHSAWGPKPWMINLEWSFSSSLGGPSLWRELQGARHAVSLMAETHTELLRLLLEQSRYFQF